MEIVELKKADNQLMYSRSSRKPVELERELMIRRSDNVAPI